jgi:dihydroneopterin aldolase/D-erythro-7,8-dihydroneopterin triphosphate epimerase
VTDRVFIHDLRLRCIIGVNDWEREKRQEVLINIEMEADCSPAGTSDDLSEAVDYRRVAKEVIALVEGSDFLLVERMAEEVAGICLKDPKVEGVRVRVEKPGAVRFARSVGVEVERRRKG